MSKVCLVKTDTTADNKKYTQSFLPELLQIEHLLETYREPYKGTSIFMSRLSNCPT